MPSFPRTVEVAVLSSRTSVTVSWLPPDPSNGVILQYLARILVASTGQLAGSQTVQNGQTVIFSGLDLDNVRYQIEVCASTSAGQGPCSIPVSVGTDLISTTEAPPTSDVTERPQDTTSSAQTVQTIPPTTAPGTTLPSPVTVLSSSMATSVPPTVGETQPAPVRNDEYYIVRIVPAVIVALFIIVIVVAVAMGFCCHSRVNRESKTGAYTFDPSRDYALK